MYGVIRSSVLIKRYKCITRVMQDREIRNYHDLLFKSEIQSFILHEVNELWFSSYQIIICPKPMMISSSKNIIFLQFYLHGGYWDNHIYKETGHLDRVRNFLVQESSQTKAMVRGEVQEMLLCYMQTLARIVVNF